MRAGNQGRGFGKCGLNRPSPDATNNERAPVPERIGTASTLWFFGDKEQKLIVFV